ncbi:NAD-dependent epimerase/dehydratase family protein [Halomarina litorea]|uniref:NAD-dependent epimerase/dehydratase family protein n=1 Tax=Halomarina litorea TaxID=2961595 RepID=UPI0020C35887|nr:NAD(P)-dependent oxidoreductase [Halomarina sp. BCD28]
MSDAVATTDAAGEALDYDSVVVTGGTGFLGLHTCQYFVKQGLDVTAVDLKPFDESDPVEGVSYVEADVRDESTLRETFEEADADVVVHTAAALPLWDDETIREVTVDGTRAVLWAATEADVDRVVYVSSTAVYGTHDHHPITEDSPTDGVGPYGTAKVEAEKLCADFRRRGLCVPVVRPKTFIGPQRLGVFQVLFDWVEDGANVPLVGWGNNRYQLLHVRDLVRAIEVLFTLDEERVNGTFNVGATEYTTMKEDFQALVDYAETGKRVLGTPATLTVAALRVLNALDLSPLYPWVYETAHEDSYVSVEKLRELGWEPEYSNREALIDTYQWYLEEYEEQEGETGLDHRVAWDQGALEAVKALSKRV